MSLSVVNDLSLDVLAFIHTHKLMSTVLGRHIAKSLVRDVCYSVAAAK